jgi:hypothetical protein
MSCTYERHVIDNQCQFVLRFNINAKGCIKLLLPLTFQGTVSRDGYFFWKFKYYSQPFLCMRCWFSRPSKSFSLPYIIIKFLFVSLKLLTNFENAYWNPPQNSLLCDRSTFPGVDPSLAAGKIVQELICHRRLTVLQNHNGILVSNFKGASYNFEFNSFIN